MMQQQPMMQQPMMQQPMMQQPMMQQPMMQQPMMQQPMMQQPMMQQPMMGRRMPIRQKYNTMMLLGGGIILILVIVSVGYFLLYSKTSKTSKTSESKSNNTSTTPTLTSTTPTLTSTTPTLTSTTPTLATGVVRDVNDPVVDCKGIWTGGTCIPGRNNKKLVTYSILTDSSGGGNKCEANTGDSKEEEDQGCSVVDCESKWEDQGCLPDGYERYSYFKISREPLGGGRACEAVNGSMRTEYDPTCKPKPIDCIGKWYPENCHPTKNNIKIHSFRSSPAENGGKECSYNNYETKEVADDTCKIGDYVPYVPSYIMSPPPHGGCFAGDTKIVMENGTSRFISSLKIGEETMGGIVTGIMTFARKEEDPLFVVDGQVIVSGIHALMNEDGKWSRVFSSSRAVHASNDIHKNIKNLYNIDVDSHIIYVENIKLPFSDDSEVDGASDEEIAIWDYKLNKLNGILIQK